MNNHILIVDDKPQIRGPLREFLELSGFRSSMASSAEEALTLIKNNKIEVVITDIMMPEMDGLELTDKIKKEYDTDVIVMTGHTENYSYEEAINKGASDFIFKPIRFEELLLRLKRVLKERKLSKDRDKMMKKMEQLAITDGLTKLYNSRHFYHQIEHEIQRSKRYNHPLALVLIDIDHFKNYNDTYGHLEGDKILLKLAEIINSHLRTMDSAYRYGGDEYTIILPATSGKEAATAAERINNTIKSEKFYPNLNVKPITITISAGITQYFNNEELTTFIQRTDQAMYLSKKQGRNKVTTLMADTPSTS